MQKSIIKPRETTAEHVAFTCPMAKDYESFLITFFQKSDKH